MIKVVQLSCLSSGAKLGAGTTDATPTVSTHKGTASTMHRHLGRASKPYNRPARTA